MKITPFYFFTLCHFFFLSAYAAEGSDSSGSLSSRCSLETSTDLTTSQRDLDQYIMDVLASTVPAHLSRLRNPLPAPILPPIVPAPLSQLGGSPLVPILPPIVPVPPTRLSSRGGKSGILQEKEMEVSLYSVSSSIESYGFDTEESFQPPSYTLDETTSQSRKSCFKSCWKCNRRREPQEEDDPDFP